MQPRLTTQSSDARSCTMGKAIRLADLCMMGQVSSQSGWPGGVRFMKKNFP